MTSVLYLSAPPTEPVYEDMVYLGLALNPPSLRSYVAQPVRSLDRAVRVLTGLAPETNRAVSVAWHLLNGALLWLVLPSVLAVGLFWLHPIQSEAVAYAAGRGDLLLATWVLLGMLAVQRRWLLTAAACAALAVTAKETGVVTWLLLPLWAWHLGQRWSAGVIGAWTLAVALVVVAVVVSLPASAASWPGGWYVAGQLAALGRLVWLWPQSLLMSGVLTLDHDWTWITKSAATTAVGAWGLALAVPRRWVRVACLWTIAAALPRLLLPLLDGQHERHLYVATIGISLAVVALFTREERP